VKSIRPLDRELFQWRVRNATGGTLPALTGQIFREIYFLYHLRAEKISAHKLAAPIFLGDVRLYPDSMIMIDGVTVR
jgi:hypothetical protein